MVRQAYKQDVKLKALYHVSLSRETSCALILSLKPLKTEILLLAITSLLPVDGLTWLLDTYKHLMAEYVQTLSDIERRTRTFRT